MMISLKFRCNPMLNFSLCSIIADNYRYVMRLYFIVYFKIVIFACKSSISSLLTVQGYKILASWYHWCPTTPVAISQIITLITKYAQ